MENDTRQFWFNVTGPSGSTTRIVVAGFDLAERVKQALRDADYRCGITSGVTVHFTQSKEELSAAKEILKQVRGIV